MTAHPTASIIIPCYNNAAYIAEAIDSALGQTHPDTEVIVVDDGSDDGSADIIAAYGEKITFLRQSNAGACVARNRGFEASAGQWIKFLDGDDVLLPDCIARQVEQAAGRELVVFGDYETIGSFRAGFVDTPYLDVDGVEIGKPIGLNAFFDTSMFTSTTLYPRSVIEAFGAFDTTVRRGQEHEFNVRLFINGVDYEYHPVLCYYYRQHGGAERISNARRLESYIFDFDRFEALVERARTGPRADRFASNKPILAKAAWRRGRRLLRAGQKSRAIRFFEEARAMNGEDAIVGSAIYRRTAKLAGPFAAERVARWSQRVRGRAVEFDDIDKPT